MNGRYALGSHSPVVGIVGWKNSGKTTMVERLVGIFSASGLNVATVKHAHHSFDIDRPDTDSGRHRGAGARQVAIVSQRRMALMTEFGDAPEPPLREVLARLAPCDLVIVEGYKREKLPKIELRRSAQTREAPLAPADPDIVAIAADHVVEGAGLPVLPLGEPGQVADFIKAHIMHVPEGAAR
jgi:molybdopterin-guanine dinucleotide biosynthesis adapter protein